MIIIDAPKTTALASPDATDAIQAAIDSAGGEGCHVHLPAGRYRITRSLRIVDDGLSPGMRGVRFTGDNSGVSGVVSTTIEYDPTEGGSDAPIMILHSRECIIEGLAFRVKLGKRALCAIDVDKSAIAGASICTGNQFLRCQFIGALSTGWGIMLSGIRVGATAPANCEFMHFEDCVFQWMGEPDSACSAMWSLVDSLPPNYPMYGAGIHIASTTQQSKSNTIDRCSFHYSPFGILARTGSIMARRIVAISVGSIIHTGQLSEPMHIDGVNAEQCCHMFKMGMGSSSSPWPVKFENVRFGCLASSALPTETVRSALNGLRWPFGMRSFRVGYADMCNVVHYGARGSFQLETSVFQSGGTSADALFRIGVGAGGVHVPLMVTNCTFPNDSPFSYLFGSHERSVRACYGKAPTWNRLIEDDGGKYP